MRSGVPLAALVRSSPSLAGPLRGVERAAATSSPILLLGEPGSGRSLLARAVHAASKRAAGPLVEVDLASVPSALFESEFFGVRRGAFTGAEADRAGRVERAEGGTLVLDHVEELPRPSQPKLLRLLAESRYAPLGGEERRADVRFVAIGADDLPERVERDAFRSDLFFRLEVLSFRVPPLRERRADLEVLVAALLGDLCERLDRPHSGLAAGAWQWMRDYDWPGNVRELRNLLERALVLGGEAPLEPAPPVESRAAPRSLREVEREHLRAVLAHTRGHQGRAAAILGISRKALWEKRRRHGLP